ncbi:hypothetical protein D3C75_1334310 [compost metagenome]
MIEEGAQLIKHVQVSVATGSAIYADGCCAMDIMACLAESRGLKSRLEVRGHQA